MLQWTCNVLYFIVQQSLYDFMVFKTLWQIAENLSLTKIFVYFFFKDFEPWRKNPYFDKFCERWQLFLENLGIEIKQEIQIFIPQYLGSVVLIFLNILFYVICYLKFLNQFHFNSSISLTPARTHSISK